MEERQARGTFFVLGWVAEHHPQVVRRIDEAGHEIASHGWDHRKIPAQTPEEFRSSVRRTKEVLEGITGRPVVGFRAPSFSVLPGHEWALDILLEEGYRYDSSLFPIRRPGYGYPDGHRTPHPVVRPSGHLMEFPPATLRVLGLNIPAAGGAYLRFFPFSVIRAAVKAMEAAGVPATLYVHPWELDPDQPRMQVSRVTHLRHYGGLRRTESRLVNLLDEFRFQPISATLASA
jgi:polysaccharide deacetylase family protein (PEP-CTERM system associated)